MSPELNKPRDHRGTWGPSHPPVIGANLPDGWSNGCPELEDLWYQIVKELTEKEFRNRTHGNRRTAEAGCAGPICRKGVREHSRRRAQGEASPRYKLIDPIVDYFFHQAMAQLILWDREIRRAMSTKFI